MNYFLYAKFPPPINGQSLCAKHLIKSFYIATKNPIVPINRIIFTEGNIISKLLSEIVAFYKLLRSLNVRGQSVLIISLASGLGAWFDVALLIVFSLQYLGLSPGSACTKRGFKSKSSKLEAPLLT